MMYSPWSPRWHTHGLCASEVLLAGLWIICDCQLLVKCRTNSSYIACCSVICAVEFIYLFFYAVELTKLFVYAFIICYFVDVKTRFLTHWPNYMYIHLPQQYTSFNNLNIHFRYYHIPQTRKCVTQNHIYYFYYDSCWVLLAYYF